MDSLSESAPALPKCRVSIPLSPRTRRQTTLFAVSGSQFSLPWIHLVMSFRVYVTQLMGMFCLKSLFTALKGYYRARKCTTVVGLLTQHV